MCVDNIGHIVRDEAYSETCQTFKIELFAKSPELFSEKAQSFTFDRVLKASLHFETL